MLKKTFRINKNWEFQNIYRKGKSFSSQFFAINILPNKYGFFRFGVVVSKKVTRKAVDRNLLKRQVRDSLSRLKPVSEKKFDCIVSVRPHALGKEFKVLDQELNDLFRRAQITK